MVDIPEPEEGRRPRKARKVVRSGETTWSVDPPPAKPSPTDRIENAKNAHIELLDRERQRLLDRIEQLQATVDRLGPENARLEEALANNVLATILVAIGGGAISFATFAEGASKAVAYIGAALLASGVLVLVFPALRGRGSRPARPG
jgi:hypothetical protein